MEYGLTERDALCKLGTDHFLRILGYECANLIAKTICKGGLFLIGGIVQKNAELIAKNPAFIEGLRKKPRHIVNIIDKTPIYIVKQEEVGLLGALVYSKQFMREYTHH